MNSAISAIRPRTASAAPHQRICVIQSSSIVRGIVIDAFVSFVSPSASTTSVSPAGTFAVSIV